MSDPLKREAPGFSRGSVTSDGHHLSKCGPENTTGYVLRQNGAVPLEVFASFATSNRTWVKEAQVLMGGDSPQ